MISERRKDNFNALLSKQFFFWRTYDKQEIDLIEEHEGKLTGLEFKWGDKHPSATKAFSSAYPDARFKVVNPDNYFELE